MIFYAYLIFLVKGFPKISPKTGGLLELFYQKKGAFGKDTADYLLHLQRGGGCQSNNISLLNPKGGMSKFA